MLKAYNILTITHKNTDLKTIGDFIIDNKSPEASLLVLEKIKASFKIDEIMYLATCNRVMFFFHKQNFESDDESIKKFFYQVNDKLTALNGTLGNHVEHHQGEEAIQHLLAVASSIDSMVVGEREILRQLREAYEFARSNKLCGDNIRIAMQIAVKSAKEVYGATKIGEKPVSVVSLAIQELLKQNPKKDARILMIGAGQTNVLVTKFLKKHGFEHLSVYNRTLEKAQKLALSMNGHADTLDQLDQHDKGFDILFVCTGATEHVISVDQYQSLLNGEKDKKIIIDLAVPRNVDHQIVKAFDTTYIEVDTLKHLADQNMAFRQKEISKVKEILNLELEAFQGLYQRRAIEKSLAHIPQEIKAIKQKALNEVFSKELENVDDKTRALIEEMMSYMEKKCIAVPIKNAKKTV